MGTLRTGRRDPERPRKAMHYSKARAGQIICRAQCKMKMGDPLLKNCQEFPDSDRSALNPRAGRDLLSLEPV